MKKIKIKYIVVAIVIFIGILLASNYLFGNKFKNGWCVKDNRDEYIWHINNYSFGKYQLMGWQGNSWGNPVEMRKDTLERKDFDKIQIYNQTACPELK